MVEEGLYFHLTYCEVLKEWKCTNLIYYSQPKIKYNFIFDGHIVIFGHWEKLIMIFNTIPEF